MQTMAQIMGERLGKATLNQDFLAVVEKKSLNRLNS